MADIVCRPGGVAGENPLPLALLGECPILLRRLSDRLAEIQEPEMPAIARSWAFGMPVGIALLGIWYTLALVYKSNRRVSAWDI